MMGWYDGAWNGWGGWMIGMMLLWPVLLGLAVWAVVALTRSGRHGPAAPETPRQVLDRRLAAGELSVEEYAQVRRTLEGP